MTMLGKHHSEKTKKLLEEKIYSIRRGKTYEEIYGSGKAKELRENQRKKMVGRKITWGEKISIGQMGRKSWNGGLTKETDERIRLRGLSVKGNKNGMFGKRHTPKAIKKMRERSWKSRGIKAPSLGKHWELSKKTKMKIKKTLKEKKIDNFPHYKREKHWNWKGGITPMNEKIRKSLEYKSWRKAVFDKDNYTCVKCGVKYQDGKKRIILRADHIKPFSLFPELRFIVDNGRTLCDDCHRKTHTYGKTYKNTDKR